MMRSYKENTTTISAAALGTQAWQRIGPLHRLPEFLIECGVDPAPIVSRHVTASSLLRNPDGYLPLKDLMLMLEEAAIATGRDDFGIRLGLLGCVADFGLLGQFMRNAPTLRVAIKDLMGNHFRHSRGAALYVHDETDEQTLGYLLLADSTSAMQFSMCALAFGSRLVLELTGVEPERINFACRAPTLPINKHFLRSELVFESLQYGLVYPASTLDTPVRGANPARRQVLGLAIERYAAIGSSDLRDVVRRAIVQLLVDQKLTASNVAAHVNMHRRTLSRKLAQHGTTVHTLMDEVRHTLALQLMTATSLTLTEIGEFLGYNELSSFTRWMRRLDGIAPSRNRQSDTAL